MGFCWLCHGEKTAVEFLAFPLQNPRYMVEKGRQYTLSIILFLLRLCQVNKVLRAPSHNTTDDTRAAL